jgi:GrpB-like predicted nucleotidyltransferase (UPF0157 family)
VPVHPLWRPFALADLDDLDAVLLGDVPDTPVHVVAYDAAWPAAYAALAARIRDALGGRVLALEHAGSTSVPGLAAKPVIDAVLTVADPADEAAYVPPLEGEGLVLRVREPHWEEHRMLTVPDRSVNLHVFGPGAVEPARMVAFRDWLRTHEDDRAAYGALKARLAAQGFASVMDYNNHKAALVYDLYEKVFAADPAHPHDPQPRG